MKFISLTFLFFFTLQLAHSEVLIFNFDTDPILAVNKTPGAWYKDRRVPHDFASKEFDGGKRLQIGILASDFDTNNAFYNTQGRKYSVEVAPGGSIQAELYVDSAWATTPARSDLWAVGVGDASPDSTSYVIFGFTSLEGAPRFRVVDSDNGWINLATPVIYDQWYNFRVDFTEGTYTYYLNGDHVYTDTSIGGTTHIEDVIMQAYNSNTTYNAYWDNLIVDTAINPVPEPDTSLLVIIGMCTICVTLRKRNLTN